MKYLKLLPLIFLFLSCSKDDEQSVEEFSISTSVTPENAGSISVSSEIFSPGDTAELIAIPAEGWEFQAWSGDITGSDNPREIQVKKNMNVVAFFRRKAESVVIFTINDPHGKINNFAKIKAIIDKEKETESQVFFVSGGDIFSGNPIVDYHPEKGFPIVDLMGKAGMDVSALGNHEFDYGQEILNNRMDQASFSFLCANVNKGTGTLNLPQGHVKIEKDGFEIAFVSVVETGSNNKPSSHPKKLEGLEFTEGVNAMAKYADMDAVKNADLVVALTHYGSYGDRKILETHDFVDLVIGGHNHAVYNEMVNGKYMVQSGSDLKFMTKLRLSVLDGELVGYNYELINLDEVTVQDEEMLELISAYNSRPEFFVEIGNSLADHNTAETGCFYTDALRSITRADVVFQNYGGIRAGLNFGSITPFDIYTIDPFGNGLDTFSMTVSEIEDFLEAPEVAYLAYSGPAIFRSGNEVNLYDAAGNPLPDEQVLEVALSDFISNIYPDYFGNPSHTYEKTTAEYLIDYLQMEQSVIDYDGCNRGI